MKLYRPIWLILVTLIASLLLLCSRTEEEVLPELDEPLSVLLTTNQGEIEIRLSTDYAPRHSENFARLCTDGFYDNTYFHRVAPGVLIQGGDPNTRDNDPSNDGLGGHPFNGPGTQLDVELSTLKHRKGAVSMARGTDLNSAGSQFFIMLRDNPLLDGEYSVFGEVVRGIEVVERIAEEPGPEHPEKGGFNPERKQIILKCTLLEPTPEISPDPER